MYYHLGSIALGSLLIALFQMLRITLTYLYNKAKTTTNKPLQYILACFLCCATLIEKVLCLVNKNAYIEVNNLLNFQIAVYGYSFCKGAKVASNLLSRNALQFVAMSWISGFLSVCGKFLISCLTCIAAIAMLNVYVGEAMISSSFTVLIFVRITCTYYRLYL
jgi:solute carrier family 44 protein 1 (choline transporter-like protein)